jgi:DNA-binding response OmpR family regulator
MYHLRGGDVPPAVVFVTAYDKYALRAFDAGALDYLLKPFDNARFERALELLPSRFSPWRGRTDVPTAPTTIPQDELKCSLTLAQPDNIEILNTLKAGPTECIGCGGLSLDRCKLANPRGIGLASMAPLPFFG